LQTFRENLSFPFSVQEPAGTFFVQEVSRPVYMGPAGYPKCQ